MKDFLLFRRMVSPIVIPLLFWVLVVLIMIGGVRELFVPWHLWKGIQVLVIGPLLARVFCELLLILFRIDESLNIIKANKSE